MIPHIVYAFRRLLAAPVFTATAILMLALGIGLSTNTFSVTNAVVLTGLPFPDADRLLRIFTVSDQFADLPLAPGNYLDLRDAVTSFESVAAFVDMQHNVAEPGKTPEMQYGMTATANFLRTLRIQPVLGRDFAIDEDRPGKAPVVVLTNSYWRRRFNADEKILGRTLRIGTTDTTVIGVLPPKFDEARLWHGCGFVANLTVWPAWRDQRTDKWISLFGRLKTGVTRATAQAELDGLAQRLRREHPTENGRDRLRAVPLAASGVDSNSQRLYWLMVALSVLVLIIACANLAGLQLARAFTQSHAFAIRAALGASRTQLMAPLLTESVVITGVGAALGLVFASWANQLVVHYSGGEAVPLEGRVILFVVAAALLTAVVFGFAPAWISTRTRGSDALKDTARGTTSGPLQQRLKLGLVAGQLALALVLIVAATSFALGVRSFVHRDLGWKPEGLAAGVVNVPYEIFKAQEKNPVLIEQMRQALLAIPGVERAAVVTGVPFYGYADARKLVVEGDVARAPGQEPAADVFPVGADYFPMLKIPLREGHWLPAKYKVGDPQVVVINAAAARHFWPNQSALGKRLKFIGENEWNEVIGVAGDVNLTLTLDHAASAMQIYRPVEAEPSIWYTFTVQSRVPAATLLPAVRKAIASVNPDIMLQNFSDLPELLASLSRNPMMLIALSSFAGAGLLISLIGLFGVMVQLTQQRRREIGVRFALGASARHVIGLVVGRGMVIVGAGIVAGGLGAVVVQRVYQASMPELPLPGLGMQVVIAVAFVVTALAACFIPAWQAAKVDPAEVLRAE